MSVQWNTRPDPRAAAAACARHIGALLEDALASQERATMAVSGGTTPGMLFQQLVSAGVSFERVHLFFVDERCVPPNDADSNFKLAADNLIGPGHIQMRQVHRIHGEDRPPAAAQQYISDIRSFFGLEDGQMPHFDIVQCGMGAEGHTASLFPGEPLIDDRENIAAALMVKQVGKWRVSLMPGALLAAKNTVFLVTGANKAPAVGEIFNGEFNPQQYPAQLISRQGRKVTWFLDQPAAVEIAK